MSLIGARYHGHDGAAGYDVLLETPFFEYFDRRDKPGNWPTWLTET